MATDGTEKTCTYYYGGTNGENVAYVYDGSGTLKTKNQYRNQDSVVENRSYVWRNGQLLCERIQKIGTANSEYQYLYYFYNQTGLFGFRWGGVNYYYIKNYLGDILEIRRADNHSLVASYGYDAWGNHKVYDADGSENTDPDFVGNLNSFRYRGYYYDADTKLYYLQTRWYDPEIGRFVNLDQIAYLDPETINGLNLYAYCLNNPVMGYDPTGTVWWWLVGAIVGAVVGFVATVIEDFVDDGKVFNGSVSAGEYVAKTAIGAGVGAIGGEVFGAAGSVASSLAPVAVAEEAVAVSSAAVEVASITLAVGYLCIIPNHGTPNSKVFDGGSIGFYDENGNISVRIDEGHKHFIKEIQSYFDPHAHVFDWYLHNGVWRYKTTVLPLIKSLLRLFI